MKFRIVILPLNCTTHSLNSMLDKYSSLDERQLIPKEIKLLNRDLKNAEKNHSTIVKFLAGYTLITCIPGAFFFFRLPSLQERYLLFACVIIFLYIGLRTFLERHVELKKERKSLQFALSENKANVIKTDAFIYLPQHKDEGAHYLFQLSDNKVLSVGGQDFYPGKKFPSNDFEIALCFGINDEFIMLEIHSYGEKISPIRKITGKEKWNLLSCVNYPDPEKFTIISGKLENIEVIIKNEQID